MTEQSHGGSAGLRNKANIEIIHQRRAKRDKKNVFAPNGLNELDKNGRGVQVSTTYHLQISDVTNQYNVEKRSEQRPLQRRLDQPLLKYFSMDYIIPDDFNSTLTTFLKIDNSLLSYMHKQLAESPKFVNPEDLTKGELANARKERDDAAKMPEWKAPPPRKNFFPT